MTMVQTRDAAAAANIVRRAPTQIAERRGTARYRTVYRVVRVEAGDDKGLACIRDISDHGIGLELYMPVLLGDDIAIHLMEGVTVWGRVAWSSEGECGVRFEDAIDSTALLRQLAAQTRSAKTRPLPVPVATTGVARGERGICAVDVEDVSQQDMKVGQNGGFREGLRVKVSFASGMERCGIVRWSRQGIAGIMLLDPFSPKEVGTTHGL